VNKGFNHQTPQFQVSSAYTKGEMAKNIKNGSSYPFYPTFRNFALLLSRLHSILFTTVARNV